MAAHFAPMVLRDSGLWKYPSAKGGGEDFGKPNQQVCWCINLDAHELGLIQQSDKEFEDSLHPLDDQGRPQTDVLVPKEGGWTRARVICLPWLNH